MANSTSSGVVNVRIFPNYHIGRMPPSMSTQQKRKQNKIATIHSPSQAEILYNSKNHQTAHPLKERRTTRGCTLPSPQANLLNPTNSAQQNVKSIENAA
jgi:hypothetical protein